MAKVLIASIGGAPYDPSTKNIKPGYSPTEYFQPGDPDHCVSTSYVIEALMRFHGIEKLIIIGTAGSYWLSFYIYLLDHPDFMGQLELDEDLFATLEVLNVAAIKRNLDPAAVRESLEPLKQAMGEFCLDIIILKYGVDEAELLANFTLLQRIGELLQNGDEVFFDITHAFRSLPYYELMAFNYSKDVLQKNISVEMVSYGMLEASREFGGKTPLVDMSALLSMLDYMKAADEYQRFGTAYALSEVLERTEGMIISREERKAFSLINDAISANNLNQFKLLIKRCHNVTKNPSAKAGNAQYQFLAQTIFRDLNDRFFEKLEDDFELQLELAKWHFEKKRYIASAITLVEAVVSFGITQCGLEPQDPTTRDKIRSKLNRGRSSNSQVGSFLKYYNDVRIIRNQLSHALNPADQKKQLNQLEEKAKGLATIYRNLFKDSADDNRAEEPEQTGENAPPRNEVNKNDLRVALS